MRILVRSHPIDRLYACDWLEAAPQGSKATRPPSGGDRVPLDLHVRVLRRRHWHTVFVLLPCLVVAACIAAFYFDVLPLESVGFGGNWALLVFAAVAVFLSALETIRIISRLRADESSVARDTSALLLRQFEEDHSMLFDASATSPEAQWVALIDVLRATTKARLTGFVPHVDSGRARTSLGAGALRADDASWWPEVQRSMHTAGAIFFLPHPSPSVERELGEVCRSPRLLARTYFLLLPPPPSSFDDSAPSKLDRWGLLQAELERSGLVVQDLPAHRKWTPVFVAVRGDRAVRVAAVYGRDDDQLDTEAFSYLFRIASTWMRAEPGPDARDAPASEAR